MDPAKLAAAETMLARLQGRLSAIEGGATKASVLSDLKAMRTGLVTSTDAAKTEAAEVAALAAECDQAQLQNDKLITQIVHLKRALGEESGTSKAEPTAAAAVAASTRTPDSGCGVEAATATVEGPDGSSYDATAKLYFDAMQLCECDATVLGVSTVEEKGAVRTVVILNQTVMHPQGGGQPTDVGTISVGDAVFKVDMVKAIGGNLDSLVYHFGEFCGGHFGVGTTCHVSVDAAKRSWYSRLHSAGHLVDDAMKICGMSLKPTKGYHFEDGPYVEYEGAVPESEREPLAKKLSETVASLIAAGSPVRVVQVNYEEIPKLCGELFAAGPLMALLPKDRTTRVVIVHELGCPCGGTHVSNIKEIGKMVVTKIRVKKGKTKVSYKVE